MELNSAPHVGSLFFSRKVMKLKMLVQILLSLMKYLAPVIRICKYPKDEIDRAL